MNKFIMDNGKIRNCTSNIAKMNIYEYMCFTLFKTGFIKYTLIDIVKNYKDGFENLFYAIANTILIILFPLTLILKAKVEIKSAIETVERKKKIFKPSIREGENNEKI